MNATGYVIGNMILAQLSNCPQFKSGAIWSDGTEILCRTEAQADAIAQLAIPGKPESMTISKVIPFDIEGTHFYAQFVGDGVNIYDGMTGDFLRDFDDMEEAFEWAKEGKHEEL